jgi:hypothetical protein
MLETDCAVAGVVGSPDVNKRERRDIKEEEDTGRQNALHPSSAKIFNIKLALTKARGGITVAAEMSRCRKLQVLALFVWGQQPEWTGHRNHLSMPGRCGNPLD